MSVSLLADCRDLPGLMAYAAQHVDGRGDGNHSVVESLFLQRVAGANGDQLELLAWCRWLLCCRRFEFPIDVTRADQILSSAGLSKDAQAALLLTDVDAHHDGARERKNAQACRAMCSAQNRLLSVARFGRASYFLTLLACSAQVVTDTTELEAAVAKLPLHCLDGRVANVLTDVRLMVSLQPSLARLRGGLFALRTAVCAAMGASLAHGFWDARPVLETIDALEALLPRLPTRSPNFSVMVQRASVTGTRSLNLLRLGLDPFEGGERHILLARSESLENCWASSDAVWFEYADVWIEALPLFIHEERDKERGVDTIVIEQDAMELALRSLSQRWCNNIANVMLSEYIDLARTLGGADVLALAVRIECFWRDNAVLVAEGKTTLGSHYDALAKAVAANPFPLTDVEKQLSEWDSKKPSSWTFSAVQRLAHLRSQSEYLLAQKRRKYPTWIILTTQASGMSDAFAGHWVDEELALANVCEAFKDESGQSLEALAKTVLQKERARIEAIARALIAEFELEYLLEEGTVMSVLRSYSDLAKEVASQYVLEEVGALEELEMFMLANHERLRAAAEAVVRSENEEIGKNQPLDHAIYGRELHKRMRSLARSEVIAKLSPLCHWQVSGHWPHVLRLRLDLGATTARQELLAQFRLGSDGVVRRSQDGGQPLFLQMNSPVFAWTASGSCKQYNRGYGPSRVDLGTRERYTTEQLAQWIGPADAQARLAMTEFYRLYNWDVRAFDEVAQGETMKPLENSLMEMSLGITHLFIPLFQAINSGNLLKLFRESNQRSEVFTRAGGGGSSGFCQPKDIYFLPFVTLSLSNKILEHAGVPMENWELISGVRRSLLKQVSSAAVMDDRHALAELEKMLSAAPSQKFALPPLSSMRAFSRIGFGDVHSNPARAVETMIAGYHAEVIAAVEGRMRFAPVNLIHLIKSALAARGVAYDKSILVVPVEYKPVSDARMSLGLRLLELLTGQGEHLCVPMGSTGNLLTKFILNGFDPSDEELVTELTQRLGASPAELTALFPLCKTGPADVRMVSPFNLASEALFSYVSGSTLRQTALQLMRVMQNNGLGPEVVAANCLTYGADLSRWSGLEKANRDALKTAALHALVFSMRLMDAEYRATRGTHLLQAAEGSDVFTILVHYDNLTGSEDAGDAVPHAVSGQSVAHDERRIIDDLPRLRDAMRKNRPESALILLDAPVQGRKTCLDGLAVKQWAALGGWYAAPTMAPRQVRQLEQQAKTERDIAWALAEDLANANVFAELQDIARTRGYDFATDEERFALEASSWWRGGGFNNHSLRHRWQTEAWARCCEAKSIGDLDLGVLVVCGLGLSLNGAPQYYITDVLSRVRSAFAKTQCTLRPLFSEEEIASICYALIKPCYDSTSAGVRGTLIKGESSSLKRAEKDAEVAAGRALLNYNLKRSAAATSARARGWQMPQAGDYDSLTREGTISDEAFGQFLRATHDRLLKLVGDGDAAMLARAKAVFFAGKGLDEEGWSTFMGRGDDIGDVGRLALRARGDKALLAVIAHVGGMLNVCYCLSQTLMFHQMDAKEMARIGVHAVERETMEALAKCFSKVIYDHTFDYWPAFMQPSKSGHGFSDYDNIMGKWLGEGKPLNREECMVVAYDSHKWLDGYVDRLMRTKTWMRTLTTDAADALLGTETVDAIGGTCSQCFSATEQSWWRFAQKRELAFLSQQGHEIAGVVENYRADLTKPTILICSPIGRPHLTVFLKEAPTYGKCNLVLSRAYYFKDNVMRVPQGLMYVSHEEFARICPDATISNRNEKGVMVAVKFATPLVNHFSMPFHGAPYYQQGLDEQIGLPSSQSWIHCLSPGYSKGEEHQIYRGTDLYPAEERWLSRYHALGDDAETLRRITHGHAKWPGLRNLTFWRVISKPFRQSGGRGALSCVLRDVNGVLDEEAVARFAVALKEQGERDDQVVQQLVSSTPYAWGTELMLDSIRSNLVQKGIAVPTADTPLFVYSRIISIWKPERMKEVVELVVASRMAVSNVGLGGVLFKWDPRYSVHAEQLSKQRRKAGSESMPLVEKRAEYVWDAIVNGDAQLLADEPDFGKMKGRLGRKTDLTGWPYSRPRYLMHDLLDVPVVELAGKKIIGPDILEVRGSDALVVIDKSDPAKWVPRQVSIAGWQAVKIEDNIGYGLWQPYDQDEMRQEHIVAKKEGRAANPLNWGGDLREIMNSFTEAARLYQKALGFQPGEENQAAERVSKQQQEVPKDDGAMAEALRKLGKSSLEGDDITLYRKEVLTRGFPQFAGGVAELARLGRHYLHLRGHIVSAQYAERLAHLVLDDQFSFSSCLQECVISSDPIDIMGPLFVFLCDSLSGVRDEVFALGVPAQGTVAIVLTQHLGNDGKMREGLVLSGAVYRWATFARPVTPSFVHVLALGHDEIAEHHRISALLPSSVQRSNNNVARVSAAALADSKCATTSKLVHLCRVPAALLLPRDASSLQSWIGSLFAENAQLDKMALRLQPDEGTEGRDHRLVEVTRGGSLSHLVKAANDMLESHGAVCLRQEVGNVLYDGRRVSLRVIVSSVFPGKYQCDGGYVQVASDVESITSNFGGGKALPWSQFSLDKATETAVKKAARDAVEGLNLGLSHDLQLRLAGVDIVLELQASGKCVPWVIDVNPRPAGLRHATAFQSPSLLWEKSSFGLVSLIEADADDWHIPLLKVSQAEVDELAEYLSRSLETDKDPHLLLKQGRACMVLGDILNQDRTLKIDLNCVARSPAIRARIAAAIADPGLDYIAFQCAFLAAANEHEMDDFEHSLKSLQRPRVQQVTVSKCESRSGMRIGLSSGNASDNWTHTKLRGSAVLNCAIDLGDAAVVSVSAERLFEQDVVVLESNDALPPSGIKRAVFRNGIAECIEFANGEKSTKAAWCTLADINDMADPLRMLKFAITFAGGLSGVALRLFNGGVSRSGFASSSTVACNLLNGLYRACGVEVEISHLGSLALLFENQLGLKSGRQDVDGPLFSGLKNITYRSTTGVVLPEIEKLNVPLNIVLVDTGVRRPADSSLTRGLNMRHLSFLSREPAAFLCVRKSLGLHFEIVEAVKAANWPLVGRLFSEYMALREVIDPTATGEKHVLRVQLFDRLLAEGLVYGGMFSGAMGGGIAMLVPIPDKKAALLTRLREIAAEKDSVFRHMVQIDFKVNTLGIEAAIHP